MMYSNSKMLVLVCFIIGVPNRTLGVHFLKYPGDTAITQGQTAVLECEVGDRKPWETMYWAFLWEDGDGLWRYIQINNRLEISHEDIANAIGRYNFVDRGIYSHSSLVEEQYTSGSGGINRTVIVETYTLSIDDARHLDSGLYMCVSKPEYVIDGDISLDTGGSTAQLAVLISANEKGVIRCDTSFYTRELGRAVVYLNCMVINSAVVQEGSTLVWMRNKHQLKSSVGSSLIATYTIQHEDNGQTFDCVLQEPGNDVRATCSVLPFIVLPKVSLTPKSQLVFEGSDAIFTCVASGIPSIKTFVWYVDDIRVFIRDTGTNIFIEDGNCTSTLRVKRVEVSYDRRIICVAAVSSGVSANQSARLTVQRTVDFETVLSPEDEVTAVQLSSVYFKCSVKPVELKDVASYTWLVDGKIIVHRDASSELSNNSLASLASGLHLEIIDGRSRGSVLHAKDLGSSDYLVNITCVLAIPNLKPRHKSCLLSFEQREEEGMAKYVVIIMGTGGSCFVLGMLAALILFIVYPTSFLKRWAAPPRQQVTSAETVEESPTDPHRKSDKMAENSMYVSTLSHHAYAVIELDNKKTESEKLAVTYEKIPADLDRSTYCATLPKTSVKKFKTQPASGTLKSDSVKAGAEKGYTSAKVTKIIKKWPPTNDETGYEIPSALVNKHVC